MHGMPRRLRLQYPDAKGCPLSPLKMSLAIYPHSEYSFAVRSNIGNTVIETESFIRQATTLWSPAELDDLKDYVARNPLAGNEMPGTGGLRKRKEK